MKRPSLLGLALVPGVLSWLVDFCCIWLVMRAVGIAVPPAAGLLVLLAVNLVITLPAMPGNVGTFEFGVLAALRPLGVPTELALAFALLYHLAQVLPVVLLALIDSRFIARATPPTAPPPAQGPPGSDD